MLTDRVLIHQGKAQRYGTQFVNDGSGLNRAKMGGSSARRSTPCIRWPRTARGNIRVSFGALYETSRAE